MLSPLGFPSGALSDPNHTVDATYKVGKNTYTFSQWFDQKINNCNDSSVKKQLIEMRDQVYASQNGIWALTLPDGVDGMPPVNSIPGVTLGPQPPGNDGNIPPENQ